MFSNVLYHLFFRAKKEKNGKTNGEANLRPS